MKQDLSTKIICSFSGGRTSAFMANLLLQNYKRDDLLFVFANTGKENPETLDFINECDKRWNLGVVWIEAVVNFEKGKGTGYRIVDYKTASRNGEPFSDVNKKYGIPNKHQPHCTRELKEVPIKKFVRDVCGSKYKMAIGIRADERTRINRSRAAKFKWVYPLVDDFPTTKRMVKDFWKAQDFDLQLDDYLGNCDLCWKKSLKKRMKILHENPSIGDWWEKEEMKDEYVFDRSGLTIQEVKEKAKLKASQISLFDLSNESQCSCFSNIV
jgi:3'-phosphoadenosine 5'-phosphosulfate sulfotransferase (PAPS reductase)/FAD synthetase